MKEMNAIEIQLVAGGLEWQDSEESNNVWEYEGIFYGEQPIGGISGSIGGSFDFYNIHS